MKDVLRDIQSGEFAKRIIADAHQGSPRVIADRTAAANHPMEDTGRQLRAMLPWLKNVDGTKSP
jgi:ketol-acid reductoisomerase